MFSPTRWCAPSQRPRTQHRLARRPWLGVTPIVAALLLLTACSSAPKSAAADVPDVDVRRLPPERKKSLPDVMVQAADRSRVLGLATAPVSIMVVSDYQCPTCQRWFTGTLPAVRAALVDAGVARLTLVHYPLREHPLAVRAASAALCAGVQGKFWEASTRLFATQAQWGTLTDAAAQAQPALADAAKAQIDSVVATVGVESFAFRECVQSGRLLRQIHQDIRWADANGVGGVLQLLIGSHRLTGEASIAAIRAAVDSTRNGH